MTKEELTQTIQNAGQFSFSRSGGPGGQNVNKVNTKVLLTMALTDLTGLDESEIGRIRRKLAGRINGKDELFLQFQEERSQLMNRERAVEKMADLILDALFIQKKRRKTKPTRASKQRRLEGKKKQSNKKKSRGRVSFPD